MPFSHIRTYSELYNIIYSRFYSADEFTNIFPLPLLREERDLEFIEEKLVKHKKFTCYESHLTFKGRWFLYIMNKHYGRINDK